MRRYAQTGARKDLLPARDFDMAPRRAFESALTASSRVQGPPALGSAGPIVTAMPPPQCRLRRALVAPGDDAAIVKALAVIDDEKAPAQTRLEYITILGG